MNEVGIGWTDKEVGGHVPSPSVSAPKEMLRAPWNESRIHEGWGGGGREREREREREKCCGTTDEYRGRVGEERRRRGPAGQADKGTRNERWTNP